jgi:hypothetical protein
MTPAERRKLRKERKAEELEKGREISKHQHVEGAAGLSKEDRKENQIKHFASMAYTSLIRINQIQNEATKLGVDIGEVQEIDWYPIIVEVKALAGL